MSKRVFNTEKGPATGAPYSQAVIYDNLIFVSGQVALDLETNKMATGGVEQEVRQALNNLEMILKEMGSSLEKVLKVSVFLNDIKEFEKVNAVYKRFFKEEPPARSCVGVKSLPFGAKVEIEAIAHL